jgi:hypothetical protein
MSASSQLLQPEHWFHDLRLDEDAVRVLMVEGSLACASLLEGLLARAPRGRFDIVRSQSLVADLDDELELGGYDALLIDLARLGHAAREAVEWASRAAHRLPVILLTGTEDRLLTQPADAACVEERPLQRRLDRADIPATILRAIRRHRRVGAGGAEPVFCRIPRG